MIQVQAAKAVLAFAGIIVFFAGIRLGVDLLRWTGIGLVVVAFLLRFLKSNPSTSSKEEQ